MNPQALTNICEQVYRRFPETAGSRPRLQNRPDGQVLLIFRGTGKTADGHAINHTIRVTASPDGKISKITTSK